MQDIITTLREVIGNADFYIDNGNYSQSIDYGAVVEYFVASLVLLVVISSVFKFLRLLVK